MEKMYFVEVIDGEQIKREYTNEEYEQADQEQKEWENKQNAKLSARKKLEALGLTDEEIAAL